MSDWSRRIRLLLSCSLLLLFAAAGPAVAAFPADDTVPAGCARLLFADVVALDQVFFWNRLGAVQPQGMIFALRRDVVPSASSPTDILQPGAVQLRSDKRPRPLVLRMNVGDCLRITFQNLLSPGQVDQEQPATRWASVHAIGMELVSANTDDGSFVGTNPNGLANVGQYATYTLRAGREGEHLLYSMGTTSGGEGDGGQINSGLFGAIVVEPAGARWYRSQVTRNDLGYATTGTAGGYPILNYEAVYPAGHPRAGTPVLSMLDAGNNIVHSDLTAIISGSSPATGGAFPEAAFPLNRYTYPRRFEPFREFTIIYHDEIGAVQAFPHFEQAQWSHTLHSGRDGFAINYGTGGVGAEVLANRLGVGPMWDCVDCKFEEFFLTSWAVGDPAMVVDVPANAPCMVTTGDPNSVSSDPLFQPDVQGLRNGNPCAPTPGPKATRAFYPDDPSNVYHSYLSDHTRYRVMHAGSKEHHIHHLHAHQWLYSADSDTSSYLDSQALGPGSSFTTEIAYEGSGNRNLTAGDSIFHCHFYPHFAQGMWALWRVHDVLELGTVLTDRGRPAAGSRALPDGEIAAGTPIPAVVPLPGKPMAPLPAAVSIVGGQVQVTGAGHPGFPFFVPGIAGHRPPSPPLDVVDSGGLERHVVAGGTAVSTLTPLDFSKDSVTLNVNWLPEAGTAVEDVAMKFHEQPTVATFTPGGAPGLFKLNGKARIQGAPFADPCPATARPIRYQGADIQLDATFNKKGWHFGQQRISSLWQDVNDFIAGTKPPEPLFFRANSDDCIRYEFTNLVPDYYEQDDFEVRTPTDILGQHIHLVKFDVLASDGGGNGYNYEDGSLSPGEVRQRINAIRAYNGCAPGDVSPEKCPVAVAHPFFGPGPHGEWMGAQTTVQRWWADPVQDNAGNDRTLRTVFTHDHYGPSTHQQAGLYAGLVIEEKGSRWFHNETGVQFGLREDGGPTSWQAVIEGEKETFREFLFEFGDFQQAYWDGQPVNPPGKEEILLSTNNDLVERQCPNGAATCPELVSADESGTMVINYRNEPLALRVRDPLTNGQAAGDAGDLSLAFSSTVTRADADLNVQPAFYPPLTTDLRPGDPYTPLVRAYENDRVHIRILVGAHEEGHNFNIHGIKWLFEPSDPNSGYRNSQMMGISEHYEFIVPQLIKNGSGPYIDRLYSAGSSTDDLWNGIWGIFRAYSGRRQDLVTLSTNPNGRANLEPGAVGAFDFSCPKAAPLRAFDVTAVAASTALPNGAIVYNSRDDGALGKLSDPTGILYVRTTDLTTVGGVKKLKTGAPVEPLVLRARAGECIELTLRNALPAQPLELDGYNTLPMIVEGFNANDIRPSSRVGLHPQLLYYDVTRYDGADIGINTAVNGNATQTAPPGGSRTYKWYAGDVFINPDGTVTPTPIEFGATNLISSDRIEHASKGAIGALIIEPQNASWAEDCTYDALGNPIFGCTRASATVENPLALSSQDARFRELVLQFQNDVNMRIGGLSDDEVVGRRLPAGFPNYGTPVRSLGVNDDAEDSGQKALNYRTEPLWKRMGHASETPTTTTRNLTDWWDVVSNGKVGNPPVPLPTALPGDPVTPVFLVSAGDAVRFRVLQSGGHSRNEVFSVHGHQWDKEPYVSNSTRIGRNTFSFWEGARFGHGPTNHFDAVVRNGAGGASRVPGDYLIRDFVSIGFDNGLWALMRVR
ncbi:MAG TPA: copper oxidase [Acidobacteria bacterium]|nr:copper oxidase [Acidobacteriota bacterium]